MIPPFAQWLREHIHMGATVLDIGSGDKWYWQHVLEAQWIGLDASPQHDPTFCLDLETTDLPEIKTDFALMADLLEHLGKARGKQILQQAMTRAECVMVLTPLTWSENTAPYHDPKGNYFHNPYVFHKSLWGPEDFEGFTQILDVCPGYYHGIWRA